MYRRLVAVLLVLPWSAAAAPAPPALGTDYRASAARIIEAALADSGAYTKLAYLCDHIGARPSGSPAMARAIAWAQEALTADGHENVHSEEVKVPVWVRGPEEAELRRPIERPLVLLGLGGSVPTPAAGLEGDVVVAPTFEALEKMGPAVKGKIVLFSHHLDPVEPGAVPAYGAAVPYRVDGAVRAARLGAVAVLVRSLATHSLRTPHTGAMKYDDAKPAGATGDSKGKTPHIPAAALATEDADLLVRLVEAGERVTVRLRMANHTRPDATEANVLAELRGREHPEEVVVIGAHLDSWDVGQGANDDGTGVTMAMEALTVLRRLGLHPRRTIRLVLFANEETAGRGGQGYAERHRSELPLHAAALETDTGGGRPMGLALTKEGPGLDKLHELTALLTAVGANRARTGGFGGADLHMLAQANVPVLGYDTDASRYFDYHHSQADTLDKVDVGDLRRNVAAIAVAAYVLADMPGRLDR